MLVPILRAAHCRSTHHFFAIDALERLGTESGRRLGELLLKHYARYLKGAKDPDDSFKDFQNHVIHVTQNNWGGAPRACQQWLDKAMQHLRSGQWSEAAYACGVLSHYFTDPIMPLHTGQTPKESVVHRPLEWSVCKAYEEIYATCQFKQAAYQLKLQEDDNWIAAAVLDCARIANSHYERLIEIYNLARGVADPPRGLTKEARQILADLFDLAMGGWAAILMRMAADMPTMPPDCSLTLSTVIAGLDMPRAMVIRKFTNAAQRAEVQRIFDEFTETGKVVDNLPAEQKVVRREFAKHLQELQAPLAPAPAAALVPARPKAAELPLVAPVAPVIEEDDDELATDDFPHPQTTDEADDNRDADDESESDEEYDEDDEDYAAAEVEEEDDDDVADDEDEVVDEEEDDHKVKRRAQRATSSREASGSRVSYESPLVDAPSIGPKTADRFTAIGVHTIGEFLDNDASAMAEALAADWITPELIEDWQDQAALVCELDILCGYKSQLLVAVDCRTVDDLASADAAHLHAKIAKFAGSKEGQRILRKTAVPKREDVAAWVEAAKAAE